MARQNAIGFALSRFLDPARGEDVPTINLKKVFSTCRDKFCSINGAPVGRVLDEGMRQERAMLAQTETKSKASLGNRNGRADKSDSLDPQFAKLKKGLSLALRDISNLKNQPSQGEHREGTCRAQFQEQEGSFSGCGGWWQETQSTS
jgi:hypothetical protein